MTVKKEDTVKVEFVGKLEDGTVFDSSEKQGQPLEVKIGEGQLIPGFEKALVGMKEGQEKSITLEPKDAYGPENKDLVKEFPRDKFPQNTDLKEGMMLTMNSPDGRKIPTRIKKVDENSVIIDLNHPLAGKTLVFEIKIAEVS